MSKITNKSAAVRTGLDKSRNHANVKEVAPDRVTRRFNRKATNLGIMAQVDFFMSVFKKQHKRLMFWLLEETVRVVPAGCCVSSESKSLFHLVNIG